VVALRAEQLLEAVVGARQVGDGIAVEQPGPVAAGDLVKAVLAETSSDRRRWLCELRIANPQEAEVDAAPTNDPFTFKSKRVGRPPDIEILFPRVRVTGLPAPYRDTSVPFIDD
jgi:hypothetical protein